MATPSTFNINALVTIYPKKDQGGTTPTAAYIATKAQFLLGDHNNGNVQSSISSWANDTTGTTSSIVGRKDNLYFLPQFLGTNNNLTEISRYAHKLNVC